MDVSIPPSELQPREQSIEQSHWPLPCFFSVSRKIENNSQGTDLIRFRSFSYFGPACFGGCDKWQDINFIYKQTTSCGRERKMSLETISHIARVSATANTFVATTDKYRSMFSKGLPNSRVILQAQESSVYYQVRKKYQFRIRKQRPWGLRFQSRHRKL